jgi:hypothetical protein
MLIVIPCTYETQEQLQNMSNEHSTILQLRLQKTIALLPSSLALAVLASAASAVPCATAQGATQQPADLGSLICSPAPRAAASLAASFGRLRQAFSVEDRRRAPGRRNLILWHSYTHFTMPGPIQMFVWRGSVQIAENRQKSRRLRRPRYLGSLAARTADTYRQKSLNFRKRRRLRWIS